MTNAALITPVFTYWRMNGMCDEVGTSEEKFKAFNVMLIEMGSVECFTIVTVEFRYCAV